MQFAKKPTKQKQVSINDTKRATHCLRLVTGNWCRPRSGSSPLGMLWCVFPENMIGQRLFPFHALLNQLQTMELRVMLSDARWLLGENAWKIAIKKSKPCSGIKLVVSGSKSMTVSQGNNSLQLHLLLSQGKQRGTARHKNKTNKKRTPTRFVPKSCAD